MQETFLKLQEIIVEQMGCKQEEVTLTATIMDDLGADSFDVVELIMGVEEDFNVEIPDEDAEAMQTVDDIVSYIDKKVG